MVYDLTMIEAFYKTYKAKIECVRNVLKRPLTLAEKVLYAHLYNEKEMKAYRRGEDYVNFRPDRVAMQDATAQIIAIHKCRTRTGSCPVYSTLRPSYPSLQRSERRCGHSDKYQRRGLQLSP